MSNVKFSKMSLSFFFFQCVSRCPFKQCPYKKRNEKRPVLRGKGTRITIDGYHLSLSSAHNIWFTIFFFSGVKLVYIKQQMRTMSRLEFIAIRTVFRPRHILPLPFRFSVSKTSFPPYIIHVYVPARPSIPTKCVPHSTTLFYIFSRGSQIRIVVFRGLW